MKTYNCECGYITENKQAFCGHRGHCNIVHPELKNKDYSYLKGRKFSLSVPIWNKGLTKETDARVLQYSNSLKGKSHPQSIETRKKISESTKKNPLAGGKRHGSGRGKKGWYKNYFCDSTYELVYVIYNIDHNIKFERCNLIYPYTYNCEEHLYYPDFILQDGSLVEIKGYHTDRVDAKLRAVTDRNIIVLYEKDLKYAFDYVKETYKYNKLVDLYDK